MVENYRAVVILNNVSKVFETVLYEQIFNHVKGLIVPNQHGFFSGRSTSTNLVSITQFISEVLDNGSQVDVIYTDVAKAFDRVDHGILLTKLDQYGLCTQLINFLKSYLNNRTSYVQYRGFQSVNVNVTSGVPQGSIFGPLLFTIFINDITCNLKCSSLLYADDMKLYYRIESEKDCEVMQEDLATLSNWCNKNRLFLNISKCVSLSFTRKVNPIDYAYTIDNILLKKCNEFKDLGVTFDTRLSFSSHINNIITDAYKSLGFILRNCKEFDEPQTVLLLFIAFVRPKLEYCSAIWYPSYNVHSVSIEKIQRRFVKYLWFKSDGLYPPVGFPNETLLSRFNLSTLSKRRDFTTVQFLYNVINNKIDCPDILHKIMFLVPNLQTRSVHSCFYLSVPRTNLLMFSPLYIMCRNYDKIIDVVDIFNCKLLDLRKLYLSVE